MRITIVLCLISGSRLHPYSRFYDKFFYYFYAIVSVCVVKDYFPLNFELNEYKYKH
jgi:hypothetical protein